jgi:hypothetical protein
MINKAKLIKYAIVGLVFFSTLKVLSIISCSREKSYNFSGRIDNITYNEKKTPTVIVKGNSYSLSTNWRFNERMNLGDSLVKERNSIIYKLIKYKTREVVFSR